MFDKILIANRGEIACRVMATARKLGVNTVAVYSDADAKSKHVQMADEAIRIGASPVAESYLQGDRIIAAAIATRAQAIHPGYGFLSENPEFVRAVESAGLVFIGPSATAIEAMGLKDAAKKLMIDAGVPVVPGYHGESQDTDTLSKEADKIGYPVLIKARAGGGGKGMRLVEKPAEFKEKLEAAQREGQSSFGDHVCIIEKYVTKPRHIEVQVFGDDHGNVVHLFERDCSLQRRHQKVIEEAPAPDMSTAVRIAMGKAAVDAAETIGYSGAGTVEFIVDGSSGLQEDGFWFMEMNTRLQVEHPVSEAITGLDFVELQLRVAAGEPLPFVQEDLKISGWAFEARVYAEDVPKGFLPAIGVVHHLSFPEGSMFGVDSIRVDSGIREGDEISPFYDPMIAKVIVHGPNRSTALKMLTMALSQTHVGGSVTNLEFLSSLSKHAGFGAGDVDTHLIARDLVSLTKLSKPREKTIALAAISSLGLVSTKSKNENNNWNILQGWRHWSPSSILVTLEINDELIARKVTAYGPSRFLVEDQDNSMELTINHIGGSSFECVNENSHETIDAVQYDRSIYVFCDGRTFEFRKPDPLASQSESERGGDNLIAPMPGMITIVTVEAGQTVSEGDNLIVLEAMKMEHSLSAPRDGTIAEVYFEPGDQVLDGALLLSMEDDRA